MPLHDWQRVPDGAFHTFHLGLCWNLAWILNEGVLPAGFEARAEESLGVRQSDVLVVEPTGEGPMDEATSSESVRHPAEQGQPVLTLVAPRRDVHRRQRRVAVYSSAGDRRVAVVEIVSRGNKDSRKRAAEMREKLLGCIESGIQVALIDLWPPSRARWADIVAAVVTDLDPTATPPPAPGRYLASLESACEADELRVGLYLDDLRVGQPLPDLRLFLAPGRSVLVPMERAYVETVAKLPPSSRALLG